ncbi:energy coupling factor transporter S component ThiW [Jeotgalibacillus haloalkalitolerans]|uniref:Energy coupling factor transporter S component ThiW n=1 Tax=Jeotgalibacillus haloalkalitolerans TaxID=3104292 RepID=A0ABU5KP27_9BACL|nr:energy coupling factor transporter S component ThiW [Jeotgalibacillus sp. HH7-29]MDZ5712843.1 energy coupling factor transporter S component ThiW [Jeotgalibacillus sp. HH7-29]
MSTRKLVVMAMFVAIAVAGSAFVSFPAGVARAYPVQHGINVIAAVLFGPGLAIVIAFMTGLVRILTGTGSLLAFPGGMIGAALAGLFYLWSGRVWMAAAGEIIGTGLIASLVAVPYAAILMGTEAGAFFFMPAFLVSSISGAVIGFVMSERLKNMSALLQI